MKRWLPILWLALPLLAMAASPSPGSIMLDELVAAYNAGDAARLDAFRARYGLKVETTDLLQFRDDSGPLRVLRVEHDDAKQIAALIQPATSDQVERIEIALTDTDPVRIESFTYVNADRPTEFAIPRLALDDALKGLKQRGNAMAADDRFAGTVLVARHGKVLAREAYGLADRGRGQRNTLDTRFRLGSMNKMFTAVAILQLAEAGKLSLQDTVGKHLPDYPNRTLAEGVTIAHLLSHTGGVGDIFGPEFDARREQLRTHSDYLALYGARAPEFAAGSQFRYANYGFVLLGAIIEKVSGQSYYDYLDAHVFTPAGMTRTGSLPESEAVDARAVAYTRRDGAWHDAADTLPWRGTAAGGGYSTVDDLLKFAEALQDGRLVPTSALAKATTPSEKQAWYGQGFITRGEGALHNYGHDGGAPGMNAVFHVYPASGYVVIALGNLDPPAAERLASWFENRLPVD